MVALNNHLELTLRHNILIIDCPEEDWFFNFQTLSTNAKIINLLSEKTKYISKKIDFIISNELLKKTVFVMPPRSLLEEEVKKKPSHEAQMISEPRDQQWRSAREFLETKNIFRPRYNKQGGLFGVGNDRKEVLAQTSLHFESDTDSFFCAFYDILPKLKGAGKSMHKVYPILIPQKKYKDYEWSIEEALGNPTSYFLACSTMLLIYLFFSILFTILNFAFT